MTVPEAVPQHVLDDYLASLRMADSLVQEFAAPENVAHQHDGALSPVLLRVYQELAELCESVRRSRAVLERTPLQGLQPSPQQLPIACASSVLEDFERRVHVLMAVLNENMQGD